jgi:hypothetical protein
MSRSPSPFTPQAKLNRIAPGAAEVGLGDILNDLITSHNALLADHKTLEAKLNADATVTDVNYGAADTAVAVVTLANR